MSVNPYSPRDLACATASIIVCDLLPHLGEETRVTLAVEIAQRVQAAIAIFYKHNTPPRPPSTDPSTN